MGGLFTLLIVSFDAQNVFNFDEFQFVYFFFVACAFGVIAKANVMKLLALHFLNEFYILGRIFGPLIHVGNFVMVLGSNLVSFLSHTYPVFPVPFVGETALLHQMVLAPLSRTTGPCTCGSVLGSLCGSPDLPACLQAAATLS